MQELTILTILADFVIFLISITIPTYAIAVSFLGPDYAKATKRISEEKKKLEEELKQKMMTQEVKLEDLAKSIDGFRQMEQKMKSRFNPLSLYPTVFFPNIFFGLGLATILFGIYNLNVQEFPWILGVSSGNIAIGLIILGWALVMIQKATKETVGEP
jgi:hypothetical protein